ncbi:hypothetical protein [Nodosilinea sp. FACHB-13]|uniref:hypothetical protein n=1 Tax=Cyanophyceae TaxID=3028117 RepID=UPI001684D0AA|nr:hypothetical protein [Nodosilinea sp. FACHB-13]MBD2105763.1 hypothetical protein [Nodosilinea sp. FACHB-13]
MRRNSGSGYSQGRYAERLPLKQPNHPVILSEALCDLDGTQAGGFGEMPQLTLTAIGQPSCPIALV